MRQSENAAKILNEKKEEGEAVLYGLRHAQQTSEAAERQAQLAYNKANQAMNVSTAEVTRVTEVQRSIDEFQRNSTITPGTTNFVDRFTWLYDEKEPAKLLTRLSKEEVG